MIILKVFIVISTSFFTTKRFRDDNKIDRILNQNINFPCRKKISNICLVFWQKQTKTHCACFQSNFMNKGEYRIGMICTRLWKVERVVVDCQPDYLTFDKKYEKFGFFAMKYVMKYVSHCESWIFLTEYLLVVNAFEPVTSLNVFFEIGSPMRRFKYHTVAISFFFNGWAKSSSALLLFFWPVLDPARHQPSCLFTWKVVSYSPSLKRQATSSSLLNSLFLWHFFFLKWK